MPEEFCRRKGLAVNCGPRGFPFVSSTFYRNRGDGTFEDVTRASGLENRRTYQLGVVFSDLDLDGDTDLYIATDSTPNLLFENQGDGTFRDRSLISGAALSHLGTDQAGMGVDAGDASGDGLFDLLVTNFADDYNTLYINQDEMRFQDATDLAHLAVASLPYLGWSAFLEDIDGDGDLDILVVNGHVYPQVDGSGVGESFRQPMQLFWNRGDGTFEPAPATELGALAEPVSARGAGLGDLDGDLDLDAVVNVMDGAPLVLQNEKRVRGVALRLVGRRSNRDGLGAVLTARLGGRLLRRELRGGRGYLSHSASRAFFGLADDNAIDELTIAWPGSSTETIEGLRPGRYTVAEGLGVIHKE